MTGPNTNGARRMGSSQTIDITGEAFARRLANLLADRRKVTGATLRELSHRDGRPFSVRFLRRVEEARAELDEETICELADLYGVDLAEILPSRLPLRIPEPGVLATSGITVHFEEGDADSLLTTYLVLVRQLRAQEREPMIDLRREDVDTIAEYLHQPGASIVERLGALDGRDADAPQGDGRHVHRRCARHRARRVRRRRARWRDRQRRRRRVPARPSARDRGDCGRDRDDQRPGARVDRCTRRCRHRLAADDERRRRALRVAGDRPRCGLRRCGRHDRRAEHLRGGRRRDHDRGGRGDADDRTGTRATDRVDRRDGDPPVPATETTATRDERADADRAGADDPDLPFDPPSTTAPPETTESTTAPQTEEPPVPTTEPSPTTTAPETTQVAVGEPPVPPPAP